MKFLQLIASFVQMGAVVPLFFLCLIHLRARRWHDSFFALLVMVTTLVFVRWALNRPVVQITPRIEFGLMFLGLVCGFLLINKIDKPMLKLERTMIQTILFPLWAYDSHKYKKQKIEDFNGKWDIHRQL